MTEMSHQKEKSTLQVPWPERNFILKFKLKKADWSYFYLYYTSGFTESFLFYYLLSYKTNHIQDFV